MWKLPPDSILYEYTDDLGDSYFISWILFLFVPNQKIVVRTQFCTVCQVFIPYKS